jgi:hypothetical protein
VDDDDDDDDDDDVLDECEERTSYRRSHLKPVPTTNTFGNSVSQSIEVTASLLES